MKTLVALINGVIVLLHQSVLTTIVEFADGTTMLSCEIAPISEFEVIGEL